MFEERKFDRFAYSNHLGGLDGHGHFIRIRALCKVIRNYLEKLKIHVYEYFIYCLIV